MGGKAYGALVAVASMAAAVSLALAGCETERVGAGADRGGSVGDGGAAGGGASGGGAASGGSTVGDGGAVGGGASTGGAAPTFTPASPYVEPGAGEGAPHYYDNNRSRLPGPMSAASAEDARREAARIEPVLKALWKQGRWDPDSVRAALLHLGYQEERLDSHGRRLSGTLSVTPMTPRFEGDHEVRPPGARIGLLVHPDACVTAFTQKADYQVSTNGPYPETTCLPPVPSH
jgi:hypothetical protein